MKKKQKKIMTVPIEKIPISDNSEIELKAIASLIASQGWAIIIRILDENIAHLEKAILEKKDPESKIELTDEEIEILRIKRSLNIELKNTPINYSEKLKQQLEETPTINPYDPYYTIEDIQKQK